MRKLAILLALPVALAAACGNNSQRPPADGGMKVDAPRDAGGGVDASCFDISNNPTPTYNEIINACTTAQKIYKNTTPPHTLPDGGLPPVQ